MEARSEHEKQAGHGWGYNSGNAELTDEKAGEALAKEEEKEGFDSTVPPPVNAEGDTWAPDTAGADDAAGADGEAATPAEPEVVTKSYDEHLAEIAEKKLQLGNQPSIRKPNEGASKKFPEGKAFARDEVENFIEGSGGKAKRERAKKEKTNPDLLKEIDPRQFLAPDKQEPSSGRGGRGRGRGGDRGGDRGSFRGRGRGGGGGDRGSRGDRPDFRGGRGGRGGGANVNVDDTSAFPSLGS
jgi:plasminogen activator inhibitor 1 RNA-binding protein